VSVPKHAKPGLRVLVPLTAALTFVIGRKAVKGRHALSSAVTSGASPAWGLVLRHLNKEPVVRPEVRA
jgi:hypothetical protein